MTVLKRAVVYSTKTLRRLPPVTGDPILHMLFIYAAPSFFHTSCT